eukprot:TRINITY_DN95705_c0_g1_i1.p1 TRINITY_DN95705_c0_g1~~TRINITY_DN95705_c0_g1_i1.p1  ORF type:complete len:293 (-),score=28.83 TRINITY_DN95705_c0_g1_i1:114-992(-)
MFTNSTQHLTILQKENPRNPTFYHQCLHHRKYPTQRASLQRELVSVPDTPRQRLEKALVIIRKAEDLNPIEPNFNTGTQLWKLLRGLDVDLKLELLDRINSQDIRNLWKIAGSRFLASKEQVMSCIGPDWDLEKEFPKQSGEVYVHEGKAAMPGILGLHRYQKLFFRDSVNSLYGRVNMRFYVRPLANLIYPLYFEVDIGSGSVPATGQLTDLRFNFFKPSELDLRNQDIPKDWPKPIRPIYPFEGDLTDHVRVVAPGIYVSWGWKKPRPEKMDIGRQSFQVVQVLKRNLDD